MNLNNCNRYDDYYEVYFITKLAFDPDKIMLKKNDILLQMVNKQTKIFTCREIGTWQIDTSSLRIPFPHKEFSRWHLLVSLKAWSWSRYSIHSHYHGLAWRRLHMSIVFIMGSWARPISWSEKFQWQFFKDR